MNFWNALNEDQKMSIIAGGTIVSLGILFTILGLFLRSDRVEYIAHLEVESKNLYNGWSKITGNPQKLTLEEFQALRNQGLLKEGK